MQKTVSKVNETAIKKLFYKALNIGLEYKLQDKVTQRHLSVKEGKKLIEEFPDKEQGVESLLKEFREKILPHCINSSSNKYMGFPDSGNSVAALTGAILKEFLQQDLMNQAYCGPSATFVEISIIKWLREIVGYRNYPINDVWDVGGIVTSGGTLSNAISMLLARENRFPGTMNNGMKSPDKCWLVVPKGIGHYSIKASTMWIGCGLHLIEVETDNYRYNLTALEKAVKKYSHKIMAVVAYAGDSRTMTVDNFDSIYSIVKSINPNIWLHADACHGFSLGFSSKLKHKLRGIEKFDSISMDPHKVMLVPYTLSVLAVKNPENMKKISISSSLIIRDDFDLGQITPFIGTKQWESLKLWFMMKNFARQGLDTLITKRHRLAKYLEKKLLRDKDFIVINNVEINSVVFLYRKGITITDVPTLNAVNKDIHKYILNEGIYHLHQFSLPDCGKIKKGEVIYPLRFMCGNPNTSQKDINLMVEYVRDVGRKMI